MAFPSLKKVPRQSQPAPQVAPTGSDVFFGVLRSEFDTPDALPEAFLAASGAFTVVLGCYRAALLGAEETAQFLARMYLTDHNGLEWTAGATTLRWYRRLPGGSWSSALPPALDDDLDLLRSAEHVGQIAQEAFDVAKGRAGQAPQPVATTRDESDDADTSPTQEPMPAPQDEAPENDYIY